MSGTCPPPPPSPCPPVCPPPPPCPPCLPKPLMRRLHYAQCKRIIFRALVLSLTAGTSYYFFVGAPRREKYRRFYEINDVEEWAEEMAKKGLFQAVPQGSKD